ncbi:MAG: NUDIX hydrolase [Candidatus Bathyarchaeota archaeon]|nr:NUDIX hydrolase [Candidatus Termiticorpusculum sp.]
MRYSGVTATAIIFCPGNKILLIKRNTLPFRGFWALPGGKLEVGEIVEHTCVREVKEEVGVDVKIVCRIGEYHEFGDREGVVYDYYPSCFVVMVVGGQVVRQESEVQEVGLFGLDDLPCPLAFEHDKMISDFRRMFNL